MSVRERKTANGSTRWVVSVHQEGKAVLRRTFTTRREALKFEREAKALLESTGSIQSLKNKQLAKQKCTLKLLFQYALNHPKGWKYSTQAQPANAEQVLEYFGPNRSPMSITSDDMLGFIDYCSKVRKNSPKTINKKLCALQTLTDIGVMLGLYRPEDTLSAKGFTLQENNGGRTRILSDEEIKTFEAVLKEQTPEVQTYFATLLHMGMRPHELWSLNKEDFKPKTMALRILRGKKRGAYNETHLPIPKSIQPLWENQINENGKVFNSVSSNHQSLSFMQSIKKQMGLDDDHLPPAERVTPYTLRHTCCTRMIRAGIPIYTVKEWMGHNSIETTLKYAHFSPAMFSSAIEALEHFSSS